jgi:hypothetical protein
MQHGQGKGSAKSEIGKSNVCLPEQAVHFSMRGTLPCFSVLVKSFFVEQKFETVRQCTGQTWQQYLTL